MRKDKPIFRGVGQTKKPWADKYKCPNCGHWTLVSKDRCDHCGFREDVVAM